MDEEVESELLQSALGLTACSLASGVGSLANAEIAPQQSLLRPPLPAISLNDQQGADVLNLSLGDPAFWKGAEVDFHQGRLYDEIRLKRLGEAGFLAYISGEGGQDFPAHAVAETVYQTQNLITEFMPALKTARYLGLPTGMDLFGERLLVTTYRNAYLYDYGDLDKPPEEIVLPFSGQREAITFGFESSDFAYVSREREKGTEKGRRRRKLTWWMTSKPLSRRALIGCRPVNSGST